MLKTRSSLIMGLSHVAAVVIGWASWAMLMPAHVKGDELSTAVTKARQRPTTSAPTVDKVLSKVAKPYPEPILAAPPDVAEKTSDDTFMTEFRHLVATMQAPADFETTLAEEMKSWDGNGIPFPRIAAVMYLWMLKDPASLIRWAGADNADMNHKALAAMKERFTLESISAKRIDALGPFLKDPGWSQGMGRTAFAKLAESADLNGIRQLKESVPPQSWRGYWSIFTFNWQWKERSKFVELAASEKWPEMIIFGFSDRWGNEPDGATWIAAIMRDESLDAGFRESIKQNNELRRIARRNQSYPLEDRLAIMQAGAQELHSEQKLWDQLTASDVQNKMRSSSDLNFQFRNGNIDATQVLAQLMQELPELSTKSPSALRETIFKNLVEQNPHAAMPLLTNLSQADRSMVVLRAAQTGFGRLDPTLFLAALNEVPANDATLRDDRLRAWTAHAENNYETLDKEYVSWVRALPDGVDREMAIYSLSAAVRDEHPDLFSTLREDLKDTDLKQRLDEEP